MTMQKRIGALRQRLQNYNDGLKDALQKQPLTGTAGVACPITLTSDFVEWLGGGLRRIDYGAETALSDITFRRGQEDIIRRLLAALEEQEKDNGSTVQPTQGS